LNFRPKNEHELDRLSDDELIAEIVAARDAGDNDAARAALGVLAFRRYDDVRRRILIRVPREHADDVAQEVFISALKSAFDGTSVGEFVKWLQTITNRRIVDFHRARPDEPDLPLAEEEAGEEGGHGVRPAEGDFSGGIDTEAVIEQAMDELSEPHRVTVQLYVFEGHKAKETAEQVNMSCKELLDTPMTEANVHQIAKRFRERLRKLLADARGPD
jgi:RNA polymerase sigma factor (sigma-70 family)